MGAKKLSGAQKAAVVMLSLGDEIAAEILKSLSDVEVRRMVSALQQVGRVDKKIADQIVAEFTDSVDTEQQRYVRGGPQATANILKVAFKGQSPEDLSAKYNVSTPVRFEVLDQVPNKALLNFLKKEHPQTVSLILAHLEPERSAELLRGFSDAHRSEVLLRIAKLESVDPEVLDELHQTLKDEFADVKNSHQFAIGGAQSVADMLAKLDRKSADVMLQQIEERDPDLADAIKGLMFRFNDLLRLSDRDIQKLLAKIPKHLLAIGLKNGVDQVRLAFGRNMSERAREHLDDEISSMPPTRVSDIEAAQQEILKIALDLEEQGVISLAAEQMV